MSIAFRIALIAFAVLTLALVLRKISQSKLLTEDAVFWFGFAFLFVLLAVFPRIAFFFSDLLGVESPANLVFLVVIAILILHTLGLSVRISALNGKISDLVQEAALVNAPVQNIEVVSESAEQSVSGECAQKDAAEAAMVDGER